MPFTLTSSRCHSELFHSLPMSQPFLGPWSNIDRYEQFPPLARETDFTQRPNNIYIPNHHIAYMTAPDVLATPELSDNYNDRNSNGLALRICEVRDCSCNFPDTSWSTLAYDDSYMAQVPPRATPESHVFFSSFNDLHAPIFAHADTTADILTGFSSLSLYPTSR